MGKIFFGFSWFSQLPPTQNPAILIVQPRHHLMDFQNQKQKQNTPFTSETSTPPIATPRTALESRQGVRSNKLKRGRPKSYKYPNTLYVWCHTSRCTLMSNNSTPLVVQRRRCTWILRCSLLVHIDSKRHVCPIALPKKRNEKKNIKPPNHSKTCMSSYPWQWTIQWRNPSFFGDDWASKKGSHGNLNAPQPKPKAVHRLWYRPRPSKPTLTDIWSHFASSFGFVWSDVHFLSRQK